MGICGRNKAGLQVTIHAIGDKAINTLLNIFERIEKENGDKEQALPDRTCAAHLSCRHKNVSPTLKSDCEHAALSCQLMMAVFRRKADWSPNASRRLTHSAH